MRGTKVLLVAATVALGLFAAAGTALADNGDPPPTLSFFSGGEGAQAHWLATSDQPPGDTDNQAIELQTTFDATASMGYAGILVHHVTGIPAESFPDSAFWNKSQCPFYLGPYTQGSPRLVVEFQNAAGQFDGYGALRENVRGFRLGTGVGQRVSTPEQHARRLSELGLGRHGRPVRLPIQRAMERCADLLRP